MFYNLSRRELRSKNGTDFKDGDTINITDSHYEIWIKYGEYQKPNMHSTVFDVNKGKFQDVVFRQDYIRDFLRRQSQSEPEQSGESTHSAPAREGEKKMTSTTKYIVRELPPEQTDFSFYFDDDGLKESGGDYCYNLFIVAQSRNSSGFNEKEYTSLQNEIKNLLEMYEDIVNKSNYAQYSSVGAMLLDLGLVNSIHNTRRIKEITEWLKACNETPNSPWRNYETQAEAFPEETTAEYLTFKTGKEWATDSAYGYCQGDYVKMVYCPEHYKDGVKHYGEIWLGAGKEFYTIDIDENGEETETCYGYIVADCQAIHDEDYKRLVCEWAGIPEGETQLEMIKDIQVTIESRANKKKREEPER